MKRIAELMHIAPATREEFLRRELNPDQEILRVLWECGVRNQQYFGMGNLLIKSFEYHGDCFREDMGRMADYLAARGQLIEKRRKDVSREEQDHVSWWAPMKKLGQFLEEAPAGVTGSREYDPMAQHSIVDIAYNDEDWVSDFHF